MIAILIKAAVSVAVIFMAYKAGRASVVREIADLNKGKSNTISEDILYYYTYYDKIS